jgi:hypothetical protein
MAGPGSRICRGQGFSVPAPERLRHNKFWLNRFAALAFQVSWRDLFHNIYGRCGLSETTDPILFRPRTAGQPATADAGGFDRARYTAFDRYELTAILDLYGRKVACGAWRDYSIDLLREKAVFSVYRKASEYALYRIEKDTRLARKQGAYSVIAAGGLIMKRGHDLRRVLSVLEDRLDVVNP